MTKQQVIDYYASFGEKEWERLTWPLGQIESVIIQDAFIRYIPQHVHVLDLGGGVGRWTIWLAQKGCRVTLADLSPRLLEIAKTKIREYSVSDLVEEAVSVDASDLNRWPAEAFDVVVCLGPFYHITDPEARGAAAREICRVLKPGGLVFAAFMPVYSFFRRTLALKDERHHLSNLHFMEELIEKGVFMNDVAGRFNSGFGIMPDQVSPYMREFGFEQLELLSDSGFAASNADQLAELATEDPEAYERTMKFVIATAGDASNLGSSIHMIFIGRKIVA